MDQNVLGSRDSGLLISKFYERYDKMNERGY